MSHETDIRAFFAEIVRPHRRELAVAIVLMLVQSVSVLAMPFFAGRFADAVIHGADLGRLLPLWFASIVVNVTLGYVIAVRTQRVALRMIADGSARVFDHLRSLPLGFHHERRRGELLSLLIDDVARLGYFVTHTATPLLPLLLTCAGGTVIMLRVEPRIGLCIACLVPVLYLVVRIASRRLRPLAHEANEAAAMKSSFAEQALALMPVVKAYLGGRLESARFRAQTNEVRDLEERQATLQYAIAPVVQVSAAAGSLVLLWFGGRAVTDGAMTPAELVTLSLYGLMLTGPVSQLASVYGNVQSARGTAERLVEVLHTPPEPDDGTVELDSVRGEIRLERVAFAYPNRAPVFDALDLVVHAGETVAITGENGAGKSTLVHLLMRFAEPAAGTLRIDGIDLRDVRLESLRSTIALVPQHVLLLHASVAENIAYGRADATREEIESAARSAAAHEFIVSLPDGYETVVGDQGIKLSGGQRQRIALARALIKCPRILILDEATAMFDPAGEEEVVAHFRAVFTDRTVILITHRPATLALADRILRLEDGGLVEVGVAHQRSVAE